MIAKIKDFVKANQNDIILFIGVFLIAFLCFALGFIIAKRQEKEPIKIEYLNEKEYSQSHSFVP